MDVEMDDVPTDDETLNNLTREVEMNVLREKIARRERAIDNKRNKRARIGADEMTGIIAYR